MTSRTATGLALVIACAVAGLMVLNRQTGRHAVPLTPPTEPQAIREPASAQPNHVTTPAAPQEITAAPEQPIANTSPRQPNPLTPANRKAPAAGNAAPLADEAVIPLPVAREALSFVGADPEAEEIWAQAINDPVLTPHQRQDLIEDLNEDGFPDPKNITLDDLPLILSRLALIEELVPDAMDEVNEAAFAEAYKDLVNMLIRLSRQ
jgi:hypothetical protein